MIYTLTLNPSLDYYMFPVGLEMGKTCRSVGERLSIGGKGINVSCVAAALGAQCCSLGFIGGFTGLELEKELNQKGIKTDFIKIKDGITRINVKLEGREFTEINAQGPYIEESELEALLGRLSRLNSGDTLIICGSVYKNASDNIYADIIEALNKKGVRCILDSSGRPFLNALVFEPYLVKPNLYELEAAVGIKIESKETLISAANILKNMGAQRVLVSLGAHGCMLLDKNGELYFQKAVSGKALNAVGAGDSMLAAFVSSPFEDSAKALKFANAAGAACAFSHALPTKEEIYKLFEQ